MFLIFLLSKLKIMIKDSKNQLPNNKIHKHRITKEPARKIPLLFITKQLKHYMLFRYILPLEFSTNIL